MAMAFRLNVKLARAGLCHGCRSLSFSTPWILIQHGESSAELVNKPTDLAESIILDELSNLSLIPPQDTQISSPPSEYYAAKDLDVAEGHIEGYLLPEEKLIGVFLQKITGKYAIEHALTSSSVDLTIDIVARVLLHGTLGGQAMITFFEWAIKQPEVPNNVDSYCIAVKALGRKRLFPLMFELLNKMNRKGIKPNERVFEIVVDSLIRANEVAKATQVFEDLEDIGLHKDTQLFNVFLHCLCRRSHVGKANSIFNRLKGVIPFDLMTYNFIIGGWSKMGKLSEIERLMKSMTEDGFDPDCLTYSHLIEGLGKVGDINGAVRVFEAMKETDCAPDVHVCNVMISVFASVKDFDKCLIFYQGLKESCEPDMGTYTILISAALKVRNVADALELFDEMLERGIVPRTGMITYFIKPLCSYGPPDAALVIYKRARSQGCEISLSAYKLLLMRLSRFGKCGTLMNVWRDMMACGYSSDADVYEYVMNGFCNAGRVDDAAIVMEEFLGKGFCPSQLMYSKLVKNLLKWNRVEKARKLCLKIKVSRENDRMRRCWRAKGWHFSA